MLMASKSVRIFVASLVVFSIAMLGCTAPTSTEETVLYSFQGLGVLSFGLPVIPGQSPAGSIQITPPEGDAYISLLVRNNAEGDYASDIIVRLENVEPFKIKECHVEQNPSDFRDDDENCAPYSEDGGLMYSEHRLGEMYPDQEVEFFWTLIAPSESEIAGMFYDHVIYYAVEYNYKVTSSQIVYAMTQAEKTSRLNDDKPVSGSMSTTSGEVRFTSNFNEPIIYSTGQSSGQDLALKYKIYNSNADGTIKPGTKMNVTVTLPGEQGSTTAYAQIPDDTFLNSYHWYKLNTNTQMTNWFTEEFLSDTPATERQGIIDRTIYREIEAEFVRETGSEFTFYVPVRLKEQIVPTSLSLPFYLRASYRYLLDCKTASECAQLRVEPVG
jgi:hypothetical protein